MRVDALGPAMVQIQLPWREEEEVAKARELVILMALFPAGNAQVAHLT